jgi:hypothetical protein
MAGGGFPPSDPAATALRACSKAAGNRLSRLAARRRIPAQALGLKKYRCRWAPVSKISDKEHTLPSLRDGTRVRFHSDMLSVQDTPACRIPALLQGVEEGPEITVFVTFPSSIRDSLILRRTGPAGMCARDILPYEPPGTKSLSKETKVERQIAARVIQPASLAGDGEALAGGASHEKVDWRNIVRGDPSEVAEIRHMRKTVREHRTREWFDFGERDGLPAQRPPGNRGGLDA